MEPNPNPNPSLNPNPNPNLDEERADGQVATKGVLLARSGEIQRGVQGDLPPVDLPYISPISRLDHAYI